MNGDDSSDSESAGCLRCDRDRDASARGLLTAYVCNAVSRFAQDGDDVAIGRRLRFVVEAVESSIADGDDEGEAAAVVLGALVAIVSEVFRDLGLAPGAAADALHDAVDLVGGWHQDWRDAVVLGAFEGDLVADGERRRAEAVERLRIVGESGGDESGGDGDAAP